MKKIVLIILAACAAASCRTVKDLEKENSNQEISERFADSPEGEEQANLDVMKDYELREELKVQDIKDTVVFVEQPVYVPAEKGLEVKREKGVKAVENSRQNGIVSPEDYSKSKFFYTFHENFVYEVYGQPLHLTDIELEEGEVVVSTPLFSEGEEVWELTAGVAKNPRTGKDIQHLFIKPAYAGLDSTLIIMTDRRIYHLRCRSFNTCHMAMVKFRYPNIHNVWATNEEQRKAGRTVEDNYIKVTNPEFISFDYKIKYSFFKKPEFLPQKVFDDGQTTYIQVDDIVLHKKLPVIFNEKDEIINYTVQKNMFIVPRLVNRITLRLGKEKVIVEKKKAKSKDSIPMSVSVQSSEQQAKYLLEKQTKKGKVTDER